MGRKSGFNPDPRCLGGAMELHATYTHMQKAAGAPKACPPATTGAPTAQVLSLHRARKLAETDTTALNHYLNMHHLQRRMQQAYSMTARRKDVYDSKAYPAPQQRTLKPNPAIVDLCPWLPRAHTSRRPSTAPGMLAAERSSGGGARSSSCSQPPDWQRFKQQQRPEPSPPVQPVQLPQSRYYPGPNLLPSVQHKLYKASIMADILERQLYRARDIRALCEHYIAANTEHRELLRRVVAEVLCELDLQ